LFTHGPEALPEFGPLSSETLTAVVSIQRANQAAVTHSMLISHKFRRGASLDQSSDWSVKIGRGVERQFLIRADIFGDYVGRKALADSPTRFGDL
jgi:hypothetical protein